MILLKLKFNENLIAKDDCLIVGVSGGVDSMVLLAYLNNLQKPLNLKIIAVHMNYHKRETADFDEQLVNKFCHEANIIFVKFDFIDTPFGNFQQEARNQRYAQFYQIANAYHTQKIVLAHHADDQIESVLMRLTRGSSYIGYAGILELSKYKDKMIIRPLLHENKENIIAYAKANQIPYHDDESNNDDLYTRNRFRHYVVPFLKNENPKVLEKISEFSEEIAESYHLISKLANIFLSEHQITNENSITIPLQSFLEEEVIIQKDILKKCTNQISNNKTELTYKNTKAILTMISSKRPNLKKQFDEHLTIIKSYNQLHFYDHETKDLPFTYQMQTFGELVFDNKDMLIISKNKRNYDGKSIELWYNNLDLLFPITIRSRAENDVLTFPYGKKKLSRVFIDKKVPTSLRNTIPIVTDNQNQIIFIPNIFTYQPKEKENTIYITYLKGKK